MEQNTLPIIFWSWGVGKFPTSHVQRTINMLHRTLNMPWRPVVISDDKATRKHFDKAGYQTVKLWDDLRHEGKCTVRLKCFDESFREIIPEPRWAWLDVDMVCVDDVTPIFQKPGRFVMSGVELGPQPVNGSLVIADHGVAPELFTEWDRELWLQNVHGRGLRYGGSDQAWIGIKANKKITKVTREDGLYSYRDDVCPRNEWGYESWRARNLVNALKHEPTGGPLPPGARLMQMNGPHSPWSEKVMGRSPWVAENWK